MTRKIFVEGANHDSKAAKTRCREGFATLFRKCGVKYPPKVEPCGGRDLAYKDFCTAFAVSTDVRLLVDSEDPIDHDGPKPEEAVNKTWEHLHRRDGWKKPKGATDEHVLLMTTCMETWIVADRGAVQRFFGKGFKEHKLPPLVDLESRSKESIYKSLDDATKDCKNSYSKGDVSFQLVGQIEPKEMKKHLPSFARAVRILKTHA